MCEGVHARERDCVRMRDSERVRTRVEEWEGRIGVVRKFRDGEAGEVGERGKLAEGGRSEGKDRWE